MKSPAPLLSLNPSGTFAGLITASIWKGRNYIRQRVDPSNPSTAGQITARLYLGSIAKAARLVLTSTQDDESTGSQGFQDARDLAPSGQSWISFLQRYAKDVYDKTIVHWAEIDGTEQGYFTTNAEDMGLVDYTPVLGGVEQTGLTSGQQLMALGFFGKDYLENAVCSAAVDDNAPTGQEVEDMALYFNETTFGA